MSQFGQATCLYLNPRYHCLNDRSYHLSFPCPTPLSEEWVSIYSKILERRAIKHGFTLLNYDCLFFDTNSTLEGSGRATVCSHSSDGSPM